MLPPDPPRSAPRIARLPLGLLPALLLLALPALDGIGQARAQQPTGTVAIVGATVIDGTGAAAMPGTTVLVRDGRIAAIGPATDLDVPADATVVDGEGRFLLPGFVDGNVHISLYSAGETFVRYEHRNAALVREAAQLHLKYGVTTVRDSYGSLPPLVQVRDEIERGETIGPRILAAGNIVGWGGPNSVTWGLTRQRGLSLWEEQMNDFLTQGTGEELLSMAPDSLRAAMEAYMDKGPDFIKYGGTGHFSDPVLITFSPRQQEVIVQAAHGRGMVAETHATSVEGLRLAIEAGLDFIQHPEALDRRIPDELVDLILEREVMCGPLSNTITGRAWQEYLEEKEKEQEEGAGDAEREAEREDRNQRELTGLELRERHALPGIELRRWNAERLIEAGCVTIPTTDNYLGSAPEFRREPKAANQEAGIGTIIAIEGLVELGMTPMEAIVASTRNGALLSGGLDDFGTVEEGKVADLILLEADPVEDIANIRRLAMVMRAGRVIDTDALPTEPVWYGKGMSLAPDGR